MLVPLLLALGWLGQDPPLPSIGAVVIAVDLQLPEGVSAEDVNLQVYGQAGSSAWDPEASELRLVHKRRWTALAESGRTPCPVTGSKDNFRYRSQPIPIYRGTERIEVKLEPCTVLHGRVSELAVSDFAWVTLTGPIPQASSNVRALLDAPKQTFRVHAHDHHRFHFGGLLPGGYELGVCYWEDGTPTPLRSILLRGEPVRKVDLRATDVSREHHTLVRCRYKGLEVTEGVEFQIERNQWQNLGVRGGGPRLRPVGYEDGGFLFPFRTTGMNPDMDLGIRTAGPYWIEQTVYPRGKPEVALDLKADLPPSDPIDQLLRDEALVGRVDIAPARLGNLGGEVWVTLFPDTKQHQANTVYFPGGNHGGWSQPLAPDGTYEFTGLRIGPHTLQVDLRGINSNALTSIPLKRVDVEVSRGEVPMRKDLFLAPVHPEGNLVVRLVNATGMQVCQPASLTYSFMGVETSMFGPLPFGGFHGKDLLFEWPEEVITFYEEAELRWSGFFLSTGPLMKGVSIIPGQAKITVEIQ